MIEQASVTKICGVATFLETREKKKSPFVADWAFHGIHLWHLNGTPIRSLNLGSE